MTIKLPKKIQEQFEFMVNNDNFQGKKPKEITPRNLLNFIESNGDVIGFGDLYKYLFDSKGFQQNQLKFLNAFYGQKHEFEDELFHFLDKDNKNVIYFYNKKEFIVSEIENLPKLVHVFGPAKLGFTRDEILDSPFDINKLKEVPLNEANSNDSND